MLRLFETLLSILFAMVRSMPKESTGTEPSFRFISKRSTAPSRGATIPVGLKAMTGLDAALDKIERSAVAPSNSSPSRRMTLT